MNCGGSTSSTPPRQFQPCYYYYCYHFTTPWIVSETTRVSRYQKGKTNLDLLEQETVSGSGIS